MDIDIIGLCETHLDKDKLITITDYTYIHFKREMQHVKAPHAFGGVGILIHDRIYANNNVSIFDKSFHSILGMEMVNKHTDVRCIYLVCYLSPEGSPYRYRCFLCSLNYSTVFGQRGRHNFLSWRF